MTPCTHRTAHRREYAAERKLLIKEVKDFHATASTLEEEQSEILDEERRAGPLERLFFQTCEDDLNIVSAVYYGGAWEGNACRKFLGLRASRSQTATQKDYVHLIETIKSEMKNLDIDAEMAEELNDFLDTTEGLVFRLKAAMRYCCNTAPEICYDDRIAGNLACRLYVRAFREAFVLKTHPLIGNKNITVKMHILETHVEDFSRMWHCTAIHGEDVIETFHKDVNELKRRLAAIKSRAMQIQTMADEQNLKYEVKSKEFNQKRAQVEEKAAKRRRMADN